jgi:hypothetical membrane protein
MERQISVWRFRVGLVCVALAIALRALAAVGIYPNLVPEAGAPISYNTFLYGRVVMMLLSIASHFVSEARTKA